MSEETYSIRVLWCIENEKIICYFSSAAPERAHWVTSQAARLSPWPPWKEKEEGEPWGSRALAQGQEVDRSEGQVVPQAETRGEDPDEEDVSTKTHNYSPSNSTKKPTNSNLSICSLKMHEQRKTKQKNDDKTPEGAVPAYLLDREGQSRAKVLSNMIKQKRKEKAVSVFSGFQLSQQEYFKSFC